MKIFKQKTKEIWYITIKKDVDFIRSHILSFCPRTILIIFIAIICYILDVEFLVAILKYKRIC